MSDKTELSKLDSLVGAALKGLVEAGASAEAIGAFAASYRTEASRILGVVESTTDTPDLQEVVTHAVTKVLNENGLLRKRKQSQPSVRFYVMVAGRKTSVTITPSEAQRLIDEKGSRNKANEFIQNLADRAPIDVANRSLWIRERMHDVVLKGEESSAMRH